jgi:predicted  nucleic acid-binding Zn-ribbon protein
VRRAIVELGPKISRLEEKVEAAEAANDEKKVERLSGELRLLREEKNLLMQEKLKLMDQRGAAEGQCASLRACTGAIVATS